MCTWLYNRNHLFTSNLQLIFVGVYRFDIYAVCISVSPLCKRECLKILYLLDFTFFQSKTPLHVNKDLIVYLMIAEFVSDQIVFTCYGLFIHKQMVPVRPPARPSARPKCY